MSTPSATGPAVEARIISHEAGVEQSRAEQLAFLDGGLVNELSDDLDVQDAGTRVITAIFPE